jgi:hypothetical protein
MDEKLSMSEEKKNTSSTAEGENSRQKEKSKE